MIVFWVLGGEQYVTVYAGRLLAGVFWSRNLNYVGSVRLTVSELLYCQR